MIQLISFQLSLHTASAPVEDWVDDSSLRNGCYYQFQHYTEGEQVSNLKKLFR
jgi:hypothetical protein